MLVQLAKLFLIGVVFSVVVTSASAGAQVQEPSPPEYGVRMRDEWIPMEDGVRLAADLYLPDGAAPGERFPALLEYLPYRKDESPDRYGIYAYFVRRGYVVARVDIRGTGISEGVLPDYEYSEQEQLDGLAVIDWLSTQPWSNGKVGMFGISWGGFNSIHMAMRRPPPLKAIISIDATDDLYQDDVHFIDGLMHIDQYEINQDLANSVTGTPELSVEETALKQRFDTKPWVLTKLQQQRDGEFWDRSSLNADYGSLQIPAFMIGGYFDGYRDSIPRMLEHVQAPVKAMVGPWNHTWPHSAIPGPEMEWRHEAVRWWDYWLKGRDTGVLDEPRFAVFVRHWHPPDPNLELVPGYWRWEEGWPVERAVEQTLALHPDRKLAPSVPTEAVHQLRYVPTAGVDAGFWWGEVVPDQRPHDAFSLVYETQPLEEDLEILGMPRAILRVSADAPLAFWIVRLSDVAPDQTVTQVTGAGFNGAHRESAMHPGPLEPGEVYDLEIELHFTSFVFPKGHRIRLAVSNSAWPMIWPTPYRMTTSLHLGGSDPTRLVIPVVPFEDRPRPSFLPPAPSDPLPLDGFSSSGDAWPGEWKTERNELARTTTVRWQGRSDSTFPWGDRKHLEKVVYEASDEHPEISSIQGETETSFDLKGRRLTWKALFELRSDRDSFYYTYTRLLYENGEKIREKNWKETVARDFQ